MLSQFAPEPVVSCAALSSAEYFQRTDAAERQALALGAQHNIAEAGHGREIIWHRDFPAELIATVSRMPLHEITQWLRVGEWGRVGEQQDADNDRAALLDFTDYGYLADVLREGLANNPTQLAALRLARALAWAEQEGAALLPQEHAVMKAVA